MCGTCGCGHADTQNHHHHHHAAGHHHHPMDPNAASHEARRIQVEQDLLQQNSVYAEDNRRYFERHGIFALNLVSSPGAGKTTLLTATIQALNTRWAVSVIEGDQQTHRDADRIRAAGARAVQINTGKGCHLDAHGVGHAVADLKPDDGSLLVIENVGNLVCPAAFDLGEAHKVAVLSVTEGDDKPLKYPDMFHAADVLVINKMDLLPYVEFDLQQCITYARRINPGLRVMQVTATQPERLREWIEWVQRNVEKKAAA